MWEGGTENNDVRYRSSTTPSPELFSSLNSQVKDVVQSTQSCVRRVALKMSCFMFP